MTDRQAQPADRAMSADDALEWLRQRLTEDNFPFFNRHPHHTTSETWAMWAERDVLAEIEAIRDALRQAPPADLREQAPIENVITTAMLGDKPTVDDMPDFIDTANRVTVAVLAVFAERERVLRERLAHDIDALLAEPPAPGAYSVQGRWYHGEGADRVALLVDEKVLGEQIVALVRGVDGAKP